MSVSNHLNNSAAENVVLSFNGSPENHLNINGALTNSASSGHSNNSNNSSGPPNNHNMGAHGAHRHGSANSGAGAPHNNHNNPSAAAHGGLVSTHGSSVLSAGVTAAATHLAGSNAVNIADYFNQLVRDKKNLQMFPNYFLHCERLLDDGSFILSCIWTVFCNFASWRFFHQTKNYVSHDSILRLNLLLK